MVCSDREQASESPAKVAAEVGNAEQPCRPWNGFLLSLSTLRQHGWCLKENGTIGPRFQKLQLCGSSCGEWEGAQETRDMRRRGDGVRGEALIQFKYFILLESFISAPFSKF